MQIICLLNRPSYMYSPFHTLWLQDCNYSNGNKTEWGYFGTRPFNCPLLDQSGSWALLPLTIHVPWASAAYHHMVSSTVDQSVSHAAFPKHNTNHTAKGETKWNGEYMEYGWFCRQTQFALEKSPLTTNFLQGSLRHLLKFRLNILMKFVKKANLDHMVRSTGFLLVFLAAKTWEKWLTRSSLFFSTSKVKIWRIFSSFCLGWFQCDWPCPNPDKIRLFLVTLGRI